jgi:hypothetical protein
MNVRPAIRNLAIIFAVILIPVAAHQLWDYLELRRLIAEIEAIRAKGEPVTELEAGAGRAPESDGAARAGRFYIAAAVLAMNANRDVYPVVSAISEWLPGGIPAPPAGAAERLQAAMAESSEALALADRAGTLTFQGFPPGTDYSYRTSELLTLSRLLGARTIGLGLLGQGDAAIESAMSALPLRRALREERWVGPLGDGIELSAILSLSQPTPAALRRLQDALQAEEADRVVDALLLERARRIEIVWRRYYGSTPQAPGSYLLPNRSVTETVMRPWITRQTVGTLRIWAELVAAARTPWPARVDAAAAMASKYASDPGTRSSSPVGLLTAIRNAAHYQRLGAYEAFARAMRPDDLIRERACVAAIAVERYRRDHNGALPGTLQDLAPAYLAAVPLDPVTGGPLLFKKAADAYTIYSAGPDRKDDGGDLTSELIKTIEQGYGRRTVRGADLGVRVLIR